MECRQFGYVCRDNRTCQCDFMYIPDSKKRSCVGGIRINIDLNNYHMCDLFVFVKE